MMHWLWASAVPVCCNIVIVSLAVGRGHGDDTLKAMQGFFHRQITGF